MRRWPRLRVYWIILSLAWDSRLQAKLLRVLQEKIVTPLGSQNEIPVDVRVIATTNRSMIAEIQEGRFRED
ncbi:MAG: sigma 54-interacting transcriptional regulator, partial [Burkholderiaceae bacterium]